MTMYTILDYVWIDGTGGLRSKVKVVHDKIIQNLDEIDQWTYDGSSTEQANGSSSEIFLKPVRLFPCPFRKNGNLIVLCETYQADGNPAKYNHRHNSKKLFDKYSDQDAWFGIEQEFFIYDCETDLPINFKKAEKQGRFYCSINGNNAFGRQIIEDHMYACLYSGIKIAGTNAEVAPAQWEFQIGICREIDAADHLWVARYILEKISEKYNKYIVYHPKPLKGDWNGSGLHTNYSNKKMRAPDGLKYIYEAIKKLELKHSLHMEIYGDHNCERMTGEHETSSYDKFTWGIANRKASIRIPNDTANGNNMYIEDRRVAANADPYLVTSRILETTCE